MKTRRPPSTARARLNLDSALEQHRHEDAKVGNKGMHAILPKLEAFTWQVNPNHASNLPLPGFFFASSRLCCSPRIMGFRMKLLNLSLSSLSRFESRLP
jgi:hypothetical protein